MKPSARFLIRSILSAFIFFAASFPYSPGAQESSLNRYRMADPDSLAASVPAVLVKTVTADPERKISDLVAYLAKGSDDPFITVKRIHDWITLNIAYDTSVPYGGKPPQQHWASVLAEKKGVCSGYANLFKKMAELAGFSCEAVGGYSRGTDLDIFTEGQEAADNHAWNVVTIGGKKYFVDCTWDAGSVEQSGYVPYYSTAFLFPDPGEMIYSHFPSDPAFQLLATPRSREEFLNLPALKSEFFARGLSFEGSPERISTASDRAEFNVRVPEGILLVAALYEHGGIELKNRASVTRQPDGTARVSVRFPRQGEFVLKLFVRRADSPKKDYAWCADLGYLASKGTAERFPSFFGVFADRACTLHSPLTSPIVPGSQVTFRITAPGAREVAVDIRGRLVPFERASEADTFEKKLAVPVARELVILGRFDEGGSFAGLVRFEVGK